MKGTLLSMNFSFIIDNKNKEREKDRKKILLITET